MRLPKESVPWATILEERNTLSALGICILENRCAFKFLHVFFGISFLFCSNIYAVNMCCAAQFMIQSIMQSVVLVNLY